MRKLINDFSLFLSQGSDNYLSCFPVVAGITNILIKNKVC